MASKGRAKGKSAPVDLEAVGLVLLALGIFILGVLIPALPTGELGRSLRALAVDRIGWGAYALPWPFLALGGLFLLKRNPRAWPRMLLGYLTFCVGVWSMLMLIAPQTAGVWAMEARARLAGIAGGLAWLPAVLLVTLGIELFLGWRPTRILRGAAVAIARAVRATIAAFLATRARLRERAAFSADVAMVRRELNELDKDLVALATLYPASGELDRWREAVRGTLTSLRRPDPETLADARADLKAWTSAVRSFAKDRAEELGAQLGAEGIEDFVAWSKGVSAEFGDPVAGSADTPRALDHLRKACALDTTALGERYRRLVRDRDLASSGLKKMTPRELASASKAHHARLEAYGAVADDAASLEEAADLLEPWRDLAEKLDRLRSEFPADEELADLDRTLAEELRRDGRATLTQLDAWTRALEAVELRARQRAQAAAHAAAQAAETGDDESRPVDGGDADAAPMLVRDDAWIPGDSFLDDDGQGAAGEGAPAGFAGRSEGRSGDASRAPESVAPDDVPPWLVGSPGAGIEVAAAGRSATTVVSERDDAKPSRGATPEVGGIPIQIPGYDLLDPLEEQAEDPEAVAREVQTRVRKIDETLANFNLQGRVVSSVRGPTVTRFEVEPAPGEKISRFANLSDDLALAMAVGSVRIEAPIPGKSVIGLEVPNASRDLIRFREAAEAGSFKRAKARLPLILGHSIDGEMVVGDLAKMPHLLIAGSTGSGKSVAVNTLIGSLVFKFLPTDLRFLMIDPKMVELTPFDGIPHLIRPVVTNPNDAAGVLLGAVAHMERRYKMMSKIGAKNLDQYNEKARNLDLPQLPFVIIVIDELADLMITSPKEVESAIMRLAQMARATGMHLVLATQRPSVDILTSLIKVNVPARVAFAVSSGHDSRTILDTMGAERLIGMGDMLFYQPGLVKPVRLQGPFISEREIGSIASFLRRQYFEDEFVEAYGDDFDPPQLHSGDADGMIDWNDDKLRDAADLVVEERQASVSRLQRRLSVGHARAGKLMDSLEALGVVGPHAGSKPRDVLVDVDELPNIFGK